MAKTNFKCMFLIDDKLYKKAILEKPSEKGSLGTEIPSSIYINPVGENRSLLSPMPANESLKKEDSKMKETDDRLPPIHQEQYVSNEAKEQQPIAPSKLSTTQKTSENVEAMDTNEVNEEDDDCDCYEEKLVKPSVSARRQKQPNKEEPLTAAGPTRGRKRSNSLNMRTQADVIQTSKKFIPEKHFSSDSSDESDWEDLKMRYRKLRGDFDSPPREKQRMKRQEKRKNGISASLTTPHSTKKGKTEIPKPSKKKQNKNHKQPNVRQQSNQNQKRKNARPIQYQQKEKTKHQHEEFVKYICTICNEDFKNKNTLERHMQNMHSQTFITNKQIEYVDRKKRKLLHEHESKKKPRHEFLCMICSTYYKTKSALQRHNTNIHGNERGHKRTQSEDNGRYIKRQKNSENKPVTYLNYF
jgi:hypothetical protein